MHYDIQTTSLLLQLFYQCFYYYHYHHRYHYPYHHFIINILCHAPSVITCIVGGAIQMTVDIYIYIYTHSTRESTDVVIIVIITFTYWQMDKIQCIRNKQSAGIWVECLWGNFWAFGVDSHRGNFWGNCPWQCSWGNFPGEFFMGLIFLQGNVRNKCPDGPGNYRSGCPDLYVRAEVFTCSGWELHHQG